MNLIKNVKLANFNVSQDEILGFLSWLFALACDYKLG